MGDGYLHCFFWATAFPENTAFNNVYYYERTRTEKFIVTGSFQEFDYAQYSVGQPGNCGFVTETLTPSLTWTDFTAGTETWTTCSPVSPSGQVVINCNIPVTDLSGAVVVAYNYNLGAQDGDAPVIVGPDLFVLNEPLNIETTTTITIPTGYTTLVATRTYSFTLTEYIEPSPEECTQDLKKARDVLARITPPPSVERLRRRNSNVHKLARREVAAPWGQCGGIGWTGPTACEHGWECVKGNDWYYQCLVDPNPPATSSTSSVVTVLECPSQTPLSCLPQTTFQCPSPSPVQCQCSSSASSLSSSSAPPASPSSTPPATPSAANTGVAGHYEQCGGKTWTGPTACEYGWHCERSDDSYSQCRPDPATPTPTYINSATAGFYQQCGGIDWTGPMQCPEGWVCEKHGDDWHWQCRPGSGSTVATSFTSSSMTFSSTEPTPTSSPSSSTTTPPPETTPPPVSVPNKSGEADRTWAIDFANEKFYTFVPGTYTLYGGDVENEYTIETSALPCPEPERRLRKRISRPRFR